jgi:hypothetical protein
MGYAILRKPFVRNIHPSPDIDARGTKRLVCPEKTAQADVRQALIYEATHLSVPDVMLDTIGPPQTAVQT